MENKKPLWEYELRYFKGKRDEAFLKNEVLLDEKYLSLKQQACAVCKTTLEEYPKLLLAIEKTAYKYEDSGLMELASAVAHGDNGYGYYHFHLMLNLKLFKNAQYDEFIYLVIQYVPIPDNGWEWEVDEFHKRDTSNFSLRLKFIAYMELLTRPDSALAELTTVSSRAFPVCVKERNEGVLALS